MNHTKWSRLPAKTLCCNHWPPHAGFSLLEVILATAILAASSMVLLSLLGLGTKYGNRAEERSLVASQAQSLLDEFLVSAASYATVGDSQLEQQERMGVLPGLPSHAYRLTARAYEPSGLDSASSGNRTRTGTNQSPTANPGLTMVTIRVFDSVEQNTDDAPLLLELSQLVRSSLLETPADSIGTSVRDPFQLLD